MNNGVLQLPMTTKYEPITVERGITADATFIQWMNKVNTYQAVGGTPAEHFHDFRKDLQIEVYSLANEKVMVVTVYNAWPSKLTLLPDMDDNANEVAIETLELQHEGFVPERIDVGFKER